MRFEKNINIAALSFFLNNKSVEFDIENKAIITSKTKEKMGKK